MNSEMNIRIKTMDAKEYTFTVDPEYTVEKLKQRVKE